MQHKTTPTGSLTGRLLLGSALGALMLATAPARAESEPDGLSVGGYFTQSLNFVSIDDSQGHTFEDEVMTQNAEIHFTARKRLDNGIKVAAHIQLEGATESDQIDEHFISLSADWGKLIFGAENGVGHLMQVRAPSFVPGLKMYDNSLTDEGIERAYDVSLGVNTIEDAHMSTKLEHISGDANKLSFITPKVGGLQLGISYTPNNNDRSGSVDNLIASDTNDTLQEDIIELALTYAGGLGGLKYKIAYSSVNGETRGVGQDPESTSTGLRIAWSDYIFEANLSTYDNLNALKGGKYRGDKIDTLNYGLRYRLGNAHWGIGWTASEEALSGQAGNITEYEEWMIGGGHKIASGVRLGYYYAESEAKRLNVAAVDNRDGDIASLGMTLDLRF